MDRWGLTWFEQPDDAWRQRYPKITSKIDELEKRVEILEREVNFDGWSDK